MLQELLEIGFFEITTDLSPNVRTFRLYEKYRGIQLRIIVTLQNRLFRVEHVFFYTANSDELELEVFGKNITVPDVIKKIKELHKISRPFNNNPETG